MYTHRQSLVAEVEEGREAALANILGHSLGACAEIDSQTAIMP
jgi:hypothetical protein